MKIWLFLVLFASKAMAEQDIPPLPPVIIVAPPIVEPASGASDGEKIVFWLNAERLKKGLAPLLQDDQGTCASSLHAADLVHHPRACEHLGYDGSTFSQRYQMCGGYAIDAGGEIIGCGYRDPAQLVEAWMKSPEHATIILDQTLHTMGAARVGSTWVVVFGR